MVLKDGTHAEWAKKLAEVVRTIRTRVLSVQNFEFVKPSIKPTEKKRGNHEYRPLVEYPLEDKVIDCLVARYMREALDGFFTDSALAFRCRHGDKAAPTIHKALANILEANLQNGLHGLFVAECDIQGFYDCVPHTLVKDSIQRLIADARRVTPLHIDGRAWAILEAYLRSYSFSRDVFPPESAANSVLQSRDTKGRYKWPVQDLRRLHDSVALPALGVPQGSAISCFVANAVLHAVDQELDKVKRELGAEFVYMRYCDDMIILARERRTCQIAFDRYRDALKKLLLPIHEPKLVVAYSREFYDSKSNLPYHWAAPAAHTIPWVQFLGYQIRYDGLVRIRRKSLEKEFVKMRDAANKLLRVLKAKDGAPISRSANAIAHRFRMKLISTAVGRRQLGQPIEGTLPMCWANGFRGLVGARFVSSHFKELDRYRESQVSRVSKQLATLPLAASDGKKIPGVNRYYGFPFSYWAQFTKIP
jgi:hypothetical protein